MRWALWTVVIVILAAASLYAFTFLIILYTRLAPATHRVETREVHPDYVFVLRTEIVRFDKDGWKQFKEVRFAEITADVPLTIELDPFPKEAAEGSEWRERVWLAVVPRAVAAQYKSAAECDNSGATGDGSYFGGGRPVPPWYNTNKQLTVTYRVQRTKSGDGLEIVQTSWSPLWQWAIVPLMGVVCFGIWLVRRSRRYLSTPSAT